MTHSRMPCFALALVLTLVPPLTAQDLVPAGTIGAAIDKQNSVILIQDEPVIARYAEQIHKQFFPKCQTLRDAEATKADLAGKNLLVYGTPEHAWLAQHAARLPFTWSEGAVELEGRKFEGKNLRVICAIKNPQDATRRALLYIAAEPRGVTEINAVFHGPTEWVVADGARTLASGNFRGGPLAPEALRADLDHLAQRIREVHPATTKGMSPELEKAIAVARAALAAPRTRAEAWRVYARVLAALHDAHSSFAAPVSGERLALPLSWLAEGPVVAEDAGDLRRGDRVVALAGLTPEQLIQKVEAYTPAENSHWLRVRAESMLADLGALAALEIATAAPVRVLIERDGKEQEVEVGLAPPAGRQRAEPWVRFTIDAEHDLGRFTLDTCVVDATYKDTLAKFFQAVHAGKIGRVAVDLRRNSGGNSGVCDEFLRYLQVEEYTSFGCEVRNSAAVREQRGLGGLGAGSRTPVKRDNAMHGDPPPFDGKLLVLTGPHTFSSGMWFAAVVQDNKLGQVVGEPTGNAPSSFGDVLTFTLPSSGLSFTLSYKSWIRPDPKRDPADTVTPDMVIERTRADVREGRDPVLERLRSKG
jgi:C-terminal processing protease CtpA/Prc